MDNKHQILLVEDEKSLGLLLKDYLELHNYTVLHAEDGNAGLEMFKENGGIDICLLDVMMPGMSGFELAKEIKKLEKNIPLIFLTAKAMREDIIEGYNVGADDYIIKPFDSEILLHKISVVLQRAYDLKVDLEGKNEFSFGKFKFEVRFRMLEFEGDSQRLSPKEASLLQLLCMHMNDVVPRELALNKIWLKDNYFTSRSMDVYIAKLRKYLKKDPSVQISNIHGKGFRLIVS